MAGAGFTVAMLHTLPHFAKQAATLLNTHWKLPEDVRLASLAKSCNELPAHFVIYTTTSVDDEPKVVGHACVKRAEEGGYIESVIVDESLRGKGLGRLLMDTCEQHIKSLGFSIAYLNTKDKQQFYKHLGYVECEPITVLGEAGRSLNQDQIRALESMFGGKASNVVAKTAQQLTWMKKQLQ